MASSLQTLTSAQEYVNFYYEKVKNEFNARGLQISKVGVIGFILHVLGFTQQDAKQYFDTLFREAFVATADEFENLNMHGSIFGYTLGLANPATIVGYFDFDISQIPEPASGYTRTIIFEDIGIKVGDMVYTLDAKYVIVGNMCQITSSDNKVTYVPFAMNNPRITITDMVQYEKEEFAFSSPYYVFGAYYPHIIELSNKDDKIYDIKVYITESLDQDPIEYEVRLLDYYSQSSDKVVFAKFLSNNRLLIELGSGVHGNYIPNATVRVVVKTTKGSLGNISKQDTLPYTGTLQLYLTDNSTGAGSSSTVSLSGNILKVHIDYASSGSDQLDGQELRMDIINFIRSRNNLMSETDFYTILKTYIPDFLLLFKKTHITDNVIYCFLPFKDNYQVPIQSQSISVKHEEFNPNNACYVYKPTFTLNGELYISPFLFYVDYLLRYYKGYIVYETISSYFSSVQNLSGSSVILKSLPLTLFVTYNTALETTQFLVQSYESILSYIFKLNIPELNIIDACMTSVSSTSFEYFYHNPDTGSGLIFDEIDITIDVYYNGEKKFIYSLNDFRMIFDISDLLTLKTFDGFVTNFTPNGEIGAEGQLTVDSMFSPDAYVLNIPVMKLDTFSENEDYYLQKYLSTFTILTGNYNRMISDEVQIRFINTDHISSDIVSLTTKQKYDFDLVFPLKITIDITAYKSLIKSNNINTTDVESELQLELAQKLSQNYTGTSVSFYKTQIIDLIHNLTWVKHCNVYVVDSAGTEIPNADFELYNQKEIISNLNKVQAITYCPMYVWWDLNNIQINMMFE